MHRFKTLLLTLLATLLIGCGGEPATPLRLGTNVWPGYEPLYLARDLGQWQAESIRLLEYPSASEVLRAFRNKSLEGASLTLDEVLLLRQLNIPVTVVLIHDISDGADVIIAKPDIKSMADLRNKRIGVESGALGAFVISRALELNGLSIEDVNIEHTDANLHEQAFKQGGVDAVVTFEPVRTMLLSAGGNEIFSSREMPGEIVDVLVVHQEFVDKNPEIIQQLVDGWFKTLAYMDSNKADAVSRMAKRLRISADEVASSYDGLLLPSRAENYKLLGGNKPALRETINKLNRSMVDMGLLDNIVDTQGVLSSQFVKGDK
jgi:NitT/TauT family transport system substrate-binding protein